MPVIGPRAAVDLVLPTGTDGNRILQFAMRNGRTAEEVIREAASVIGAVNEALIARYGGLVYMTQMDHAIYGKGGHGNRKTPRKSEFSSADPVRSDISGHMLPLYDYDDATAWTPEYLRDAWQSQIDADLRLIADSWRNRVDYDVLSRALFITENPLGTGWDVPWAIGSGVNVPYIPEQYGSYVFDSTHTHFVTQSGAVSAANCAALLEKMVKQLKHHGHTGRLTALVSEADITFYNTISGKFVKYIPQGVQAVGNSSAPGFVATTETQGIPGELFGLYLSDEGPVVELRTHERIPTAYAFMTRSYGVNHPSNGLAIREHPTVGWGMSVDPRVTSSINPQLEKLMFKALHGVGVNNRTNGVAGQMNTASYSNPTLL